MLVQLGEGAALRHHAGWIAGDDLGGHRTVNEVADPANDVARIAILLREQRGVRGRAGENSPARDLLDLRDGARVNEELHRDSDDDTRLTLSSTKSMSRGSARSMLSFSITATPSILACPTR